MIPKRRTQRAGVTVLTITGLIIHALCSTACHKHTSETLVPADMATSMQWLQICWLHIYNFNLLLQKRSWWLWRCLTPVNSLPCSRNQCEMIQTLKHSVWSCYKYPLIPCGHKVIDIDSRSTQVGCGAKAMLTGPKMCQEMISQTGSIPAFMFVGFNRIVNPTIQMLQKE